MLGILRQCGLSTRPNTVNTTDDGKQEAEDQKKRTWESETLVILAKAGASSAATAYLLKCGVLQNLAEVLDYLCTTGKGCSTIAKG